MADRLAVALERFDAANTDDPVREPDGAGGQVPRALLYGRRMSERLTAFVPDASESLTLATRAQHLCRWRIPRSDYPEGRAGYHRWRTTLQKMHAELAGEILRDVGYDDDEIAQVAALLRKKDMKRDPDAQALEDVACLVFLEHYLEPFAEEHDDDKIVTILQKTWRKMSPAGQKAALRLPLAGPMRTLVERALAGH